MSGASGERDRMDSLPDINRNKKGSALGTNGSAIPRRNITGADLRAARKAAKISQADLAKRAGVCRDTVQYWEAKPQIGRKSAGERMAEALGLRINWKPTARAGARGISWQEQANAQAETLFAAYLARSKNREAQRLARLRIICGAKTRKGGQCRNKSEPGKRRCKFHGGKSTGAKTPEGLARIAEAQKRRWARVKALGPDKINGKHLKGALASAQLNLSMSIPWAVIAYPMSPEASDTVVQSPALAR